MDGNSGESGCHGEIWSLCKDDGGGDDEAVVREVVEVVSAVVVVVVGVEAEVARTDLGAAGVIQNMRDKGGQSCETCSYVYG